jgi:drug/metabolite transporter (DMT)-like permease
MPSNGSPLPKSRLTAVLQALFVTFLWSTSWILIKIGLQTDLPALTFAGLRYSLAFLCLLPFVLLNPRQRSTLTTIDRGTWTRLLLLGFLFYCLTQGAQFLGLAFLPAATVTLLLNLTPVLVALSSGLLNREPTLPGQWGGILLTVAGTVIYFLPLDVPAGQALGLVVVLIGVMANAGSSLLGRQINRRGNLSPLLVTTISMGIGGFLLLITGSATQGLGQISHTQWLIILWLAVINTALAFTLWNQSLRTLTAVESSVINNLMLPQIVILAWIFLGESLTGRQIAGIILVGIGTLIVQIQRNGSRNVEPVSSKAE